MIHDPRAFDTAPAGMAQEGLRVSHSLRKFGWKLVCCQMLALVEDVVYSTAEFPMGFIETFSRRQPREKEAESQMNCTLQASSC